jgi:hypothetical protein
MKQFALICFFISFCSFANAQSGQSKKDSILSKITFSGDFRFRVEQDWNSRKSDGSFRTDRTRLRYRLRAGFSYQINSWSKFGANIRTGLLNKQQDPQLTLGNGFADNGLVPIGIYKVYFKAEKNGYGLTLGKDDFPFEKNNELFWSDHVCPEGIFVKKKFSFESDFISSFGLSAGHFVLRANGGSLDMDSYLQGVQITSAFFNKRLTINPAFYYLNKISDIPDGFQTYEMNYAILNLSMKGALLKNKKLKFTFDYYNNLSDYTDHPNISNNMKNERVGFSTSIAYGQLKARKDWLLMLTYGHMESFAAVDYFTQNDWARWDYSSYGSPDGRLTNFQGIRFTAAYAIRSRFILKLNYYKVEQLVATGISKENGDRIRLDLDIKF